MQRHPLTQGTTAALGVLNGRLRENVMHFRSVGEATKGLLEGRVAAVLAPRAELEAGLAGQTRFVIDSSKFAELKVDSWPLGMAVKADQPALADALAGALADLKRDGTVAAIFRRHGITHEPA